jgi:hypothetical protein
VEIRRLRDYTRLRTDLVRERTRHIQRLEKLLEDALIKLSSVASDIMGVSGRAMIEALIAGERDPYALAALAKGLLRKKHDLSSRRSPAASTTTTPSSHDCSSTRLTA